MAHEDRAKRKRENPEKSARELSKTKMYKKGGKAKKSGKINR